jgi:hypothetical protein
MSDCCQKHLDCKFCPECGHKIVAAVAAQALLQRIKSALQSQRKILSLRQHHLTNDPPNPIQSRMLKKAEASVKKWSDWESWVESAIKREAEEHPQ